MAHGGWPPLGGTLGHRPVEKASLVAYEQAYRRTEKPLLAYPQGKPKPLGHGSAPSASNMGVMVRLWAYLGKPS